MTFTQINPSTYIGRIPSGSQLVMIESGDTTFKSAIVLYGFNEVRSYRKYFTKPLVGFLYQ
jgi:hypothetical protein